MIFPVRMVFSYGQMRVSDLDGAKKKKRPLPKCPKPPPSRSQGIPTFGKMPPPKRGHPKKAACETTRDNTRQNRRPATHSRRRGTRSLSQLMRSTTSSTTSAAQRHTHTLKCLSYCAHPVSANRGHPNCVLGSLLCSCVLVPDGRG